MSVTAAPQLRWNTLSSGLLHQRISYLLWQKAIDDAIARTTSPAFALLERCGDEVGGSKTLPWNTIE